MATLFFAFLLALLTAVFALQNTDRVTVRFLIWEYESSLVIVILSSAALGAALTFLLSLGPRWRRARETSRLLETIETQGARIRELQEQLSGTPPTSSHPDC